MKASASVLDFSGLAFRVQLISSAFTRSARPSRLLAALAAGCPLLGLRAAFALAALFAKVHGLVTDEIDLPEPYRYGDSNPGFRTENWLWEADCERSVAIVSEQVRGVRLSSVESGTNFGTKFSVPQTSFEEASVTSSHDLREAPCEGALRSE